MRDSCNVDPKGGRVQPCSASFPRWPPSLAADRSPVLGRPVRDRDPGEVGAGGGPARGTRPRGGQRGWTGRAAGRSWRGGSRSPKPARGRQERGARRRRLRAQVKGRAGRAGRGGALDPNCPGAQESKLEVLCVQMCSGECANVRARACPRAVSPEPRTVCVCMHLSVRSRAPACRRRGSPGLLDHPVDRTRGGKLGSRLSPAPRSGQCAAGLSQGSVHG